LDVVGDLPDQSTDVTREHLVAELSSTLEQAGRLLRAIEKFQEVPDPQATVANDSINEIAQLQAKEIRQLRERLKDLETDQEELASRLVESEQQRGRLMNLYVATFQLHSTLNPEEVQATIAEIAVDLLGAEKFALLLRKDDGLGCDIALSRGMESDPPGPFTGGAYAGGDPMVDATLADGVLRLQAEEASDIVAAVPLQVQDAIVGVIALLKLFDHKPMLADEDRDLLDLLGAHAASALFAARVFATADRKLRTLESLVQLVRG
jgi:hypothetical protein